MPRIIAVTGFAGSGKTTAIQHLHSRGIGQRVYAGQIILDSIASRGLTQTRENEILVRTQLREAYGDNALAKVMADKILEVIGAGKSVIVDAVLTLGELDHYRARLPLPIELLAICADFEFRADRLVKRAERAYTREELRDRDQIENFSMRTDLVIASADQKIFNEGSMCQLFAALDDIFSLSDL